MMMRVATLLGLVASAGMYHVMGVAAGEDLETFQCRRSALESILLTSTHFSLSCQAPLLAQPWFNRALGK